MIRAIHLDKTDINDARLYYSRSTSLAFCNALSVITIASVIGLVM